MEQIKVDLLVTPKHTTFDGSGVLRGLSDLSKNGSIRLRVLSTDVFDPRHHTIVFFEVTKGGASRKVAIDLADRADYFSQKFLDEVDVYYKRSFFREAIAKLPEAHQRKIKPYGLNLACLGWSAAGMHINATLRVLMHRLIGAERRPLKHAILEFIANGKLLHGLPSPRAFEANGHAGESIVYQTRVWPPEPSVDNLEQVNRDRISVCRALKSAFNGRFIGGIVHDDYSRTNCPEDLLVVQNKRRSAYVKLMRAARIGVYTRGLHNAIAIKMAECLAAGLCIVSEPFKFELPQPLVEGVHYLPFRSHDECVAQCEWLLANPAAATKMRAINFDYYLKWVEPRAHVNDLLLRAFA